MSNLDLSLYRSIEALADNDIPNPILRIDFFLHAVITGEECNLEPVTKTEEYLYALATGDESRLEFYGDSITLLEEYLEALRTGDMDNLREPRTREEIILYQAITGEDLGVEPVSRIETYLSMLQNAGGLDYILSTSTNASVIPLTNSINGRVRVQEMCGDTLVNLWDDVSTFTILANFANHNFAIKCIKPNTTYTLILKCDKNISGAVNIKDINSNYSNLTSIGSVDNLNKPIVFNTNSSGDFSNPCFRLYCDVDNVKVFSAFLLEGDWTNREIPSEYFEGMKSCGETKDNTIDIRVSNGVNVSQRIIQLPQPLRGLPNGVQDRIVYLEGKNLLNIDDYVLGTGTGESGNGMSFDLVWNSANNRIRPGTPIKVIPLQEYSFNISSAFSYAVVEFNADKKQLKDSGWLSSNVKLYRTSKDCHYLGIVIRKVNNSVFSKEEVIGLAQLEIGSTSTSYEPYAPEGEGLYLEKNVGEKRVLGKDIPSSAYVDNAKILYYVLSDFPSDIAPTEDDTVIFVNCNLLPSYPARVITEKNTVGVSSRRGSNRGICIVFDKTKISSREMTQSFLDNNNFLVQYPLNKPTLTKISDVNLVCYENATVYVDSGAVAPTKTVIRYPYKQPALFSL